MSTAKQRAARVCYLYPRRRDADGNLLCAPCSPSPAAREGEDKVDRRESRGLKLLEADREQVLRQYRAGEITGAGIMRQYSIGYLTWRHWRDSALSAADLREIHKAEILKHHAAALADREPPKDALADIPRMAWMCSACGEGFDDPPDRCPKCYGSAFERIGWTG